jgi:hypothetical protein
MNPIPNIKANANGCILEKDILKALPEDVIPIWENYMRGKTVQMSDFDEWEVYEYDYTTFQRHIINLCLKHMSEEEKKK